MQRNAGLLILPYVRLQGVSMPGKEAIVLIDGNNLYHNLRGVGLRPNQIDLYKLSLAVCSHFGLHYKTSGYYNSTPNISDGEAKYFKHVRFLSEISKLPGFYVKTRKLQRHSTREILEARNKVLSVLELCDKCRAIVEANCLQCVGVSEEKEKGIDVLIAADMINKCLLGSGFDYCILISGDADFVPVAEIVESQGKMVLSAFVNHGYSAELRSKLQHWVISKDFLLKNCSRA
jgi:uncharacterized LabA/DUF88 family protein